MGHQWGLPTPTVDAIVQIASVIERQDYTRVVGAQGLGIAGLRPEQVRALVD